MVPANLTIVHERVIGTSVSSDPGLVHRKYCRVCVLDLGSRVYTFKAK